MNILWGLSILCSRSLSFLELGSFLKSLPSIKWRPMRCSNPEMVQGTTWRTDIYSVKIRPVPSLPFLSASTTSVGSTKTRNTHKKGTSGPWRVCHQMAKGPEYSSFQPFEMPAAILDLRCKKDTLLKIEDENYRSRIDLFSSSPCSFPIFTFETPFPPKRVKH